MEKFELTLASQSAIDAYIGEVHLMHYELEILKELSAVIAAGNAERLAWFAGFGDCFRQILMNVHEHRRALEFGFVEIAFKKYGWFASPKFLAFEEIKLEQSEIRIGRGRMGFGLMRSAATMAPQAAVDRFAFSVKNTTAGMQR
jgi:hypothetical protein